MTIETILNSDMSVAYITDCATSPVCAVWLSPRALVPRAPSLMTDSLLSALVARNRWLLARPAARATGLAPRWSPLVR